MIRIENNRIDKILIDEYLKEIEKAVKNMRGLDDVNSYRKSFEREFAAFIGSKYALAVNSGTDALQLALLSTGIGEGDSVIIPDLTYISTALVVKYTGAEIVLVDVKEEDLTIDEDIIEDKIRPNTKAIIAVHMFGRACNMKKLKKIALKHRLYLIEDACQALGSRYHNGNVGIFGDVSAFSFSYYKPISSLSGNGGMVVFDNPEYNERIDAYLNLWKGGKNLLNSGNKFNKISLTDISTVKVKFKYRDQIINSRNSLKKLYEEYLSGLKDIRIFKDSQNVFSVRENFHILAKDRDRLYKFLKRNNIESEYPYPPIHSLELSGKNKEKPGSCKITENYYRSGLHLPLFSFMKEAEVMQVAEAIRRFYK